MVTQPGVEPVPTPNRDTMEHMVGELARHDAIITGLANEFRGFREDFATRFDSLAREIANRSHVNWGWIVAAISLLVALASWFGTTIVAPQSVELRYAAQDRQENRDALNRHIATEAHPGALAKHAAMEARVNGIEDHLQAMIEPIKVKLDELKRHADWVLTTRVETKDLREVQRRIGILESKMLKCSPEVMEKIASENGQ